MGVMRDGHARSVPAARVQRGVTRLPGSFVEHPHGGRQVQADQTTIHMRRLRTVRTFSPKDSDITRRWHVIDASDVVLGRLASHVAVLLRGKHKPIFAPHVDTGDFVIVVNASKVALSGSKLEQKHAYRHSGYPGGLRAVSYASLMAASPERAVEKAVKGCCRRTRWAGRRCASSRCTRGPTTRTRHSSRSRTRSRRSSSSQSRGSTRN